MSIDNEDFEIVLVKMSQQSALTFRQATEAEGQEHLDKLYEVVGRLKEIERLAKNYAETILREEV